MELIHITLTELKKSRTPTKENGEIMSNTESENRSITELVSTMVNGKRVIAMEKE